MKRYTSRDIYIRSARNKMTSDLIKLVDNNTYYNEKSVLGELDLYMYNATETTFPKSLAYGVKSAVKNYETVAK